MAQISRSISGRSHPTESKDLQFLTFTNYNQTIAAETKKKVRSHAQHRVQNRKRQEKKERLATDTSTWPNADLMSDISIISPCWLGSGRSDPFKPYPIEMNLRAHELFDHLHGNTCPMFKTLNNIGFFKTVFDEAAFRQVLCTSSAHMTRLRDGTDNQEAIVLSSQAIRLLKNRIADPVLGISDGVLATIVAFACHSVMFNDVKGTLTHFNGMEAIIQRRGGLQVIKSNTVLRTVIFWVDVNAAFLQDRAPRFPIPYDILPQIYSHQFARNYGLGLLQSCITSDMISVINELLMLNDFMVGKTSGSMWGNGVFAGLHVVPLLSRLLTIRHNTTSPPLAKEESCRAGALLYLSGIRRRFGVDLTSDIHVQNLKLAICRDASRETNPIMAWLLVVGGAQSVVLEDRNWFISATADLILSFRYNTWDELMRAVRDILWVEGILENECGRFHADVVAELRSKYGHIFS